MEDGILLLQAKIAELEKRNKEMLEQMEEGEIVREDLSTVVWQKEERIKSLQKAIDNYKVELDNKDNQIGELKVLVKNLQQRIRRLEEQLSEVNKLVSKPPVKMSIQIQEVLENITSIFKKK